ncbi:G-protein coupled receptor daf-37-like [Haliotis cracherodii]|uniref:G-protein coupled receptor daf-37-like n=1 Tax=Haliotis rufescens TaxID=6454 RepID=UPI001EB0157B|nr:G-protein coupled receptor daf-37-like [Haliotis rufescens]
MANLSAQEAWSVETMSTLTPYIMSGGDNFTSTTMAPVPPPMMTPEFLQTVEYVCDQVLVPLIVCFGILGNVLSLVVLTKKEMASPTNCFLIALAVSDLLLLAIQIPHFLSFHPDWNKASSFMTFHRHFTILRYVMTNIFLTCTCWITVAVTIERFISLRFIAYPHLACTISRAKKAIAAIFIVSVLFHITKFFEYIPNPDHTKGPPLLLTELSMSKAYDRYVHISNITLTAIIPVFLLVIVNSFLIYFLMTHHRRMKRHRAGVHSSVDMTHITIIVITMVLVFIVCHSFGLFLALAIAVNGRRHVFMNPLYRSFKHINFLLVTTNSSVNFLLYSTISKKFRTTFLAIFLGKLHDKNLSWSMQNSNSNFSSKPNATSYISQISTDSSNGKGGEHSEV